MTRTTENEPEDESHPGSQAAEAPELSGSNAVS
jgi:hypothetical protein